MDDSCKRNSAKKEERAQKLEGTYTVATLQIHAWDTRATRVERARDMRGTRV